MPTRSLPLEAPRNFGERVRWLFAVFTALIAVVWALELAVAPPTGGIDLGAIASCLGMVVWSYLHHRRRLPVAATDAILLATMVGLGLTMPDEGWIWGPSFLLLFQRMLDTGRVAAIGWPIATFVMAQIVYVRVLGSDHLSGLAVLWSAASYAIAAVIISTLAQAMRAHDQTADRERILEGGRSRLLAAEDVAAVAQAACITAHELVGDPRSIATVWTEHDGAIDLLATECGDAPLRTATPPVHLPPSYLRALAEGRPFVANDALVTEMSVSLRLPRPLLGFVTIPVAVNEATLAAIVVELRTSLPEGLIETLVRFTSEVSLAWQRVTLLAGLRTANEELVAADRLKDHFLSTVSHELRTPLTAICGFAETLDGNWDRLEDGDRHNYLRIIARQARRQRDLVEDLLTMSSILARRITADTEDVTVLPVVADALETVGASARVTVPRTLRAHVDPLHLDRVLTNLLANAVKYGRPPFEVTAEHTGGSVRIVVSDHGDGVPEAFRPQLFEAFTQAETGDRRTSTGVGLGLAICRDLIAANHGTLEHAVTPGGGATFVLTLPAAAAVAEPPAVASIEANVPVSPAAH